MRALPSSVLQDRCRRQLPTTEGGCGSEFRVNVNKESQRVKEVKVSNDELTELLVWAYKQGFLDATQVLTGSVKSLDDTKIRAQLLAGLEALSKPVASDKPEADGSE